MATISRPIEQTDVSAMSRSINDGDASVSSFINGSSDTETNAPDSPPKFFVPAAAPVLSPSLRKARAIIEPGDCIVSTPMFCRHAERLRSLWSGSGPNETSMAPSEICSFSANSRPILSASRAATLAVSLIAILHSWNLARLSIAERE